MLNRSLCAAVAACLLSSAACTSGTAGSGPSPTIVENADLARSGTGRALRIGVVVNGAAPTAERDEEVVSALTEASRLLDPAVAVSVERVQIDAADDAEAAISALRELGVTAIVTLCDQVTVPAVASAALDAGLLVMTGCASLPSPDIDVDSPRLVSLSTFADAPDATAQWIVDHHDDPAVGLLSSDLVPDVSSFCSDVVAALDERDVPTVESIEFTGVLDAPDQIVEEASGAIADLDVLLVCALAPTGSDLVSEIRAVGYEQPIVVPWFSDNEAWATSANDVWIIAPASRHGDDPHDAVDPFMRSLSGGRAIDIVALDVVQLLTAAVGQTGSTSPSRLVETFASTRLASPGGTLVPSEDGVSFARTYRVLEVVEGTPALRETVRAS